MLASVPRDRAVACVSALRQAGYEAAAGIGSVTVSIWRGRAAEEMRPSCCQEQCFAEYKGVTLWN